MKIVRMLAVAVVLLTSGAIRADEASENAAVGAADGWLKLVDAGQYGASWDEAARLFRNAVSKDGWERSLKGLRAPLGSVVSRRAFSKRYTESLPGAPDGKYVVIQYETSFENKKTAIETVTPMLDGDGHWRVSGYFLK
jgi:opacity protein-like surface antigen